MGGLDVAVILFTLTLSGVWSYQCNWNWRDTENYGACKTDNWCNGRIPGLYAAEIPAGECENGYYYKCNLGEFVKLRCPVNSVFVHARRSKRWIGYCHKKKNVKDTAKWPCRQRKQDTCMLTKTTTNDNSKWCHFRDPGYYTKEIPGGECNDGYYYKCEGIKHQTLKCPKGHVFVVGFKEENNGGSHATLSSNIPRDGGTCVDLAVIELEDWPCAGKLPCWMKK